MQFCLREEQRAIGRFEKWIKFETDVAIVPVGLGMDISKDKLCITHELIGHLPGDLFVIEPFPNERPNGLIKIDRI